MLKYLFSSRGGQYGIIDVYQVNTANVAKKIEGKAASSVVSNNGITHYTKHIEYVEAYEIGDPLVIAVWHNGAYALHHPAFKQFAFIREPQNFPTHQFGAIPFEEDDDSTLENKVDFPI